NPRQETQIRAHAQRHQGGHQGEEGQRQKGAAAGAGGQPEIAHQKAAEGEAHAAPRRSFRAAKPNGSWLAATTMPPRPQCACINSLASARPFVSNAAKGSSKSHNGLAETTKRARPRRFFWPAER